MSLKCLSIDRDLCRCCLVEGSFADLAQPYLHNGREEIYSDMIKDTFDIEIRPVPGQLCVVTYKICASCIKKLREACLFRELVVKSEARFKDLYEKSTCQINNLNLNKVKQEDKDETENFTEIKDNFALLTGFDADEDICSKKLEQEIEDLANSREPGSSPINDSDDVEFDMKLEDSEDESDVSISDLNVRKTRAGTKKATQKKEKLPPKTKQKEKKQKVAKKRVKDGSKKEDAEGSQPKKRAGGRTTFVLRPEDFRKDGNVYQCSHCDKKYVHLVSFRYHLKSKHYATPKYVCPVCSEKFMTLARFTGHKLLAHNIDDRFKCNACKGAFNSDAQLRKHIDTYHMLGHMYKCNECKYESFSYEGLYKHKFKHKLVKDYHCRFCKKSFLRKANLDLHERIHTGDRRKVCKECGQAFVQKASLNYHMAKYHPEVNF